MSTQRESDERRDNNLYATLLSFRLRRRGALPSRRAAIKTRGRRRARKWKGPRQVFPSVDGKNASIAVRSPFREQVRAEIPRERERKVRNFIRRMAEPKNLPSYPKLASSIWKRVARPTYSRRGRQEKKIQNLRFPFFFFYRLIIVRCQYSLQSRRDVI